MDLDQQPSSSVNHVGRARTSAASANNLTPTVVTVTPVQPSPLSNATKIRMLAVEMELLNEFHFQKFGVCVLKMDSAYFKALHQPSPELVKIRRSLDAALDEAPPTLNNDEGDIDLDATLIVVKEEPNWTEEDTLPVEPGETDFNSDERTDSVERIATTLVNERTGFVVATPDVSLPRPADDALTTTDLSPVQDRHETQKIAIRGKRSEEIRGTNSPKAAARKKKTGPVPLTVSITRVKKSEASSKRSRPAEVSRNGGRDKKHECTFCDKAFVSTSQKSRHELTHTGEKPFKCNFCPKSFTQLGNKIMHERYHTNEKPYTCELCDKSFSGLATKTAHMRTHTREKPFQCHECLSTFARKPDKVNHMRVHNADKPCHCQYCDKSFSQNSSLSRHLRIHTNEKPRA